MNDAAPPDQAQRNRALDPVRSILVEASAGSGKTNLLARRFLRLLAEVEEPGQVVAITFTNAAAAEMRNRILAELEKAAASSLSSPVADEFEMDTLAARALQHSRAMGWDLLNLPIQLRISTIDSFCRELALQEPLLSGLGGSLDIADLPSDLYMRAARQTLEQIGGADSSLNKAIESLLLWRDNNWQELEELLVEMLKSRDRWMRDFVLDREPDWEELRNRLQRPFANAVHECLAKVDRLLNHVPNAREEILYLARFACTQLGGKRHSELAELAEFPCAPFPAEGLEEIRRSFLCLAGLLLTDEGTFRKRFDVLLGFPADRKGKKKQIMNLKGRLEAIPGLQNALASISILPPARYSDEDWLVIRASFTLLRHAAAQLRVVFAETGTVDYIEVAQIAHRALQGSDRLPTDAALDVADKIHHLLVDEFQDTSRRQYQLLAAFIAAWPERSGRTCFTVGDPKQSIYFFRDADVELFTRVKAIGLEIPEADPFPFHALALTANFRTSPHLVDRLNEMFAHVFSVADESGVSFSEVEPARVPEQNNDAQFKLHVNFSPQVRGSKAADREQAVAAITAALEKQTREIVAAIKSHLDRLAVARSRNNGNKYRIAVLGRTRKSLAPIAKALRDAAIPFRSLDLEKLSERPEILDGLALARALLNPLDRVAWLGVLRAPWCGLALDDLHLLTSSDHDDLLRRPVPELFAERSSLISPAGRQAVTRILDTLGFVPPMRANEPTASVGTRLEQVWLRLGGNYCVDATAQANLDLFWNCLDSLPGGEQDILGPALDAALEKLTAMPDPSVESDFGVQLMTIHKAKGLEFEVVIVPDLQAPSGGGKPRLLSWLERGIATPDTSGEITEFLIAPLQTKGAERGAAKKWVDRVYRMRESQEDRRILYVAATRAREELHFFARPAYKSEPDGSFSLCQPSSSLLATAWPALEQEVRDRFEDWKAAAQPQETTITSIAASAASNIVVMPAPFKPTSLRRLPPEFRAGLGEESNSNPIQIPVLESGTRASAARLYSRHEGGLLSRALGTAIHALLEELARLRVSEDWETARLALQQFTPRLAAHVRSTGIDSPKATAIVDQALHHALNASRDPVGQWILAPHISAESETRWAGIVDGGLSTVRVDRVFQAGPQPQSAGTNTWWIIDYKTAHSDNLQLTEALPELRQIFAPQLEAYGKLLRQLHGRDAILCAGLYYPRMLLLDWWEI